MLNSGKLQEKFVAELKEYLLLEGLKKSQIEQYFFEAGEIKIGKTNDRSVLGTLKEMSFYCDGVEFCHTMDLSAWLNKMIYKPINYEEPIKVFKQTLKRKYS